MKFKIKISEPDDGGNDASEVRITRRIEFNFWRTCLLTSAGLLLAWLICGDDLIRFGKFVEYAKKYNKSTTVKDYMVLMPIPQDVITEGRGKVLQNPGYND